MLIAPTTEKRATDVESFRVHANRRLAEARALDSITSCDVAGLRRVPAGMRVAMAAPMRSSITRCSSLVLATFALAACGGDDDERVGSSEDAIQVCADAGTRKGVDVSYYQGQIDWDAVAADGVDFAVARVNHGSFMDPEFDANWAGIRKAGLIRGAYQYFNPGDDPIAQANTFIAKVGEIGPGDLSPVLDVESTDGLGPNTIAKRIGKWVGRVESELGRKPIIYTGSYFWNDNVQTDAFDELPLWIAHYGTDCPNMPDAWDDWSIWQYSSSGSVSGIAGAVDVNRFNGHLKALNDLAANGWRAEVVSLDYPETLAAGASSSVELVVRNLGARSWAEDVYLGTTEPRDRPSPFAAAGWMSDSRAVAVDHDVLPDETVMLSFEITAPHEPGSYREHFNLVKEGVAWFSDIVPGGGPSDDVIALDIEVTEAEGGWVPDDGRVSDADVAVEVMNGDGGCNAGGRAGAGGWWLLLALIAWRLGTRRHKTLAVALPLVVALLAMASTAHALSKLECKVKEETGYKSGNAFAIKVVTVDGKLVERNTANAYFFMAHAAANAGVQIKVVSGFRTMAEQQYLYNCYVNCSCNSCNLAAVPGYSNHQSGSALDLNTASAGVFSWLSAHAGKYGFVRTVPSEAWHWEYVGDKPVGGPCGTLKAELVEASSDASADESGDADYRVCTGDSFNMWFDLKDVGTARWADRGAEAHFAGEGVGLEPAAGGVDELTGLARVSVADNVNDNVHPQSWGGTPGGACNDAPKCRRTVFSGAGLQGTAPDEPGIYTSTWQLHDHTPADSDRAFGPVMELSFRVERCDSQDSDEPEGAGGDFGADDRAGAPSESAGSDAGCAVAHRSGDGWWWCSAALMVLRRRRRSGAPS